MFFIALIKKMVCLMRNLSLNLDNASEVCPVHIVVSLQEHLPQTTLSDGVVLRIELVEALESVPVLKNEIA